MNERLALLVAYIEADLEAADRQLSHLAREVDAPIDVETAWRGHVLHACYGLLERTFERVAKTFENQVDDVSRYHAELLRRMTLAIPGVRPAVISSSAFSILNELRGFRHVIRHAYDQDLDPEKVGSLSRRLQAEWPTVREELLGFRDAVMTGARDQV